MSSRQQITKAPDLSPSSRPLRQQVAATGTDNLPSYIPSMLDPDVEGLIKGLATFHPALEKKAQEAIDRDYEKGKMDRLGGQKQDDASNAYVEGFNHIDGLTKGQQDAASLIKAYDTEFDKDSGNLEEFIAKKYGDLTKGFKKDDSWVQGYDKSLAPVLQGIRTKHTEYRVKAIETKVGSNAMQLLDGGVRGYVSQGMPVPPEYVEGIRGYLGKNLGVSSSRFDQLLFESVKLIGDEGNDKVYEVLKQDRADGSPGLYYDPAWKPKIDAAQIHAENVFLTKQTRAHALAEKQREERQDAALYEVFNQLYSGDAEGAKSKFDGLVKAGLFTRASDLIKWDKEFATAQNREARPEQQATETELLTRIYTGRAGIREVINSDITPGQKKGLLSEIRRVQQENRMAAAAEEKAEKAIFKSPEYRSGVEYIKGSLVSSPNPMRDPMGIGTEFDRQQRAAAELEFTRRASMTQDPVELNAIREDIVGRYLKRRKELTESNKELPGAGLIRYSTPQEAAEAGRRGLLSQEELALHVNYFKAQRSGAAAKAPNRNAEYNHAR